MLVLTEDQHLLKSAAAAFLDFEAPVSALRRLRDDGVDLGYDEALWRKIAEQGWQGLLIDDTHGGSDFGLCGAAVICEEMGRRLTASPLIETLMASVALRRAGNPQLADLWLPRLAAGESVVAIAVDEGRKHAPRRFALSATPTEAGWTLSGVKSAVPEGYGAGAFIVAAGDDGKSNETGVSLFLVESDAPGVHSQRVATVDSRNLASLHFESVEVTRDHLVGTFGQGAPVLDAVLDVGRLAIAAEMSGIAQEVFDRTLDYLKQRKQFGKLLSSYQALQHRMAHLYSELEVLKSVILAAAQAGERDLDGAKQIISAAKAKATQVARLAVSEAVQLHGGIGMTDELDIGLFMKRVRVATELWGDENFHLNRFADLRSF